ncbi:MAG: hypothetical protein WCG84_03405 [Candidatus Moraniibacteriota bacterium]
MKKVFIISLSLFFFVLIFWGIYSFVYKNNAYDASVGSNTTTFDNSPKNKTPDKKSANIFTDALLQKVLDDPIAGATMDKKNQYLWYLSSGSAATIYKKDLLSGGVETILALPYAVSQIRWSPDVTEALVQEASGNSEHWHLIQFQDKKDTPLKSGVLSPVWTNAGDRIVYVYEEQKGSPALNLSRPDGSEWSQLAPISPSAGYVVATIPQSSLVAVWNIPSAFNETHLQAVSLGGGEAQTIATSRFGADYLVSPDGLKIFTSRSDSRGGNSIISGVTNASGGEYAMLGIPTLAQKAVWSRDGKTVFYALPGGFSDGAVLPDDYRKKSFFTQDTFWKIDTTTGQKTRLVGLSDMPTETYDASKFFLDLDEQSLFFIDRNTRILYRIKL